MKVRGDFLGPPRSKDKTTQPDFYKKSKSLNKFERGSINPVTLVEIPPSGLGETYY